MDWTKYPLEKLFSFVAGIIPGSVALLMFPGRIEWFFALGFLGYPTKLALFILVAFVVGFTATTFLGAILGGIGGAIGAASYNPPYSYEIARGVTRNGGSLLRSEWAQGARTILVHVCPRRRAAIQDSCQPASGPTSRRDNGAAR
jgi:hypothetical protein